MAFMRRALLTTTLLIALAPAVRADSLADSERAELRRYLGELKLGRPGDAAVVDRLAAVSYLGFRDIVASYIALDDKAEPHTHRAFQALLERVSREALSPWPMIKLYSTEFADFLVHPLDDNELSRQLFARLLASDCRRQAADLAVRLTPEATLRHLAAGTAAGRIDLFEAWNRRLGRGHETRPIPKLEETLNKIARDFAVKHPANEVEAHLRFLASWPGLRDRYQAALQSCLTQEQEALVVAGLTVQQRSPCLLELNEKLCERWHAAPKVIEVAVRNYAFDEKVDHSEVLRRLWARLPAEQAKARRQCLFAMGVHARGNDKLALAALEERSYDFLDVAFAILRHGDPDIARKAIHLVLNDSERGHEEALRLARDLKLTGFEETAVKIALDSSREQIVRQAAMLYLQQAEGKFRRRLLPCLSLSKADLRLTAIRSFAGKQGLSSDDLGEIGPALIRVALSDPSPGHRQEAVYILGTWAQPQAVEFFRKVLADNPPVLLTDGYYNDAHYWQYRLRLVGLLGAARLGDKDARAELLALHKKGGPAERMDVLLAFIDLGEVPEVAFDDLNSPEPRLIATAAHLIAAHGDGAAKARLKAYFAAAPTWSLFRDSGIDDYNILRIVGLSDASR
jgi:hypothetical protein